MKDDTIPIFSLDDFVTRPETIQKLRDACIKVGFFYIEGHEIDPTLMKSVLEQSKKLFELPESAKVSLSDHVLSRGYTALEEETLDPAVQLTRGDTKEGYYVGDDIPADDPRYDLKRLRGPNMWPTPDRTPWTQQECDRFRTVMTEYHRAMKQLAFRLVQILALAIGLKDEHYFDSAFQEPISLLRLLHYPPISSDPEHGVFACGAHSDYGMITLLLVESATTDDPKSPLAASSGGLQIQTLHGDWIDAPPPTRRAFIVNLGDMLERWTNGLFRSTKHRVVMTAANRTDRYSVPFFYEPAFDAVVECLEVCCTDENGEPRPARYPRTTAGEHLMSKYKQTKRDFAPV